MWHAYGYKGLHRGRGGVRHFLAAGYTAFGLPGGNLSGARPGQNRKPRTTHRVHIYVADVDRDVAIDAAPPPAGQLAMTTSTYDYD